MDWNQLPQNVVATTVTLYWTCVIGMIIRSWSKFRVTSGSLPKTRLEKRMWLLWVPTILAWNLLAWNSNNAITEPIIALGMPWLTGLWYSVLVVATLAACFAFITTTRCWLGMGRNWSMAVTPSKDTELITEGLFSKVRHPIYALSLMLMISTMVVVANWMMFLVGSVHCSMLFLKAWNEERYLCQTHGIQYEEYQQRTNRFIPIRALWAACLPGKNR
ncbi:MAG: isoprenylcysteine carboxylmethyltransferase family protein [Planctomycetota bacterium]|nr:isoprenylcysteine carboxylmethyltransferase family protein [Planctomycetota bacterium]